MCRHFHVLATFVNSIHVLYTLQTAGERVYTQQHRYAINIISFDIYRSNRTGFTISYETNTI